MAKRRKHPGPTVTNVALAWYDPVQWAKLKAVADDPEKMDDCHADWRRGAERCERELRKLGIIASRVSIDIESLVAWCSANKLPINSESRAQYAVELASRLDQSESK